jgi:hypothetical protein
LLAQPKNPPFILPQLGLIFLVMILLRFFLWGFKFNNFPAGIGATKMTDLMRKFRVMALGAIHKGWWSKPEMTAPFSLACLRRLSFR